MANWEVYIIETVSGKLYTGITTDLDRRFQEHLSGEKGAKFFNISSPKKIVWRESCKDRSMASKREYQIKQMSKIKKMELIKGSNEHE